MTKQQTFWILIVLVIAVIIAWPFFKPESNQHPRMTSDVVQPSNSETQKASNSSMTNQPRTVISESSNVPTPAEIGAKYDQGLIGKGEVIFEMQRRQYLQPQNLYGKVIDQYGNPVAGAKIEAGDEGLDATGRVWPQTFTTESDSDGLFEITGKTGTPIGVKLSKSGYLWGGHEENYKAPPGGTSNPTDRVILTMWKLHGAEPLANSSLDAKIPHDGTSTRFDIATGKQSANGDLQITLIRSPLEVKRGREIFDWAVKIEILGGGILPENDPYPYWAPENDYQSSFEFYMKSNSIPWSSSFESNFYIKTARGQYGRMQANIYSALTPARIQFNFTINPSGSQNLEPSLEK